MNSTYRHIEAASLAFGDQFYPAAWEDDENPLPYAYIVDSIHDVYSGHADCFVCDETREGFLTVTVMRGPAYSNEDTASIMMPQTHLVTLV